jgi:uncharacterized protein (DUF58 family)
MRYPVPGLSDGRRLAAGGRRRASAAVSWRWRPGGATVSLAAAVATAAGGALLTLAALTFDAAPLLVPGAGFLLIGVLVPAWMAICARGAGVRRRLGTHRVVEDEALEATIVVSRGPLGLPGARVLDPIAGAAVAVSAPLSVVSGASRVELRVVARVHRRGRHLFEPPSLAFSDTLRLVQISKPGLGTADELMVLPRTEPVRWLQPHSRRPARGDTARAQQEPMRAGEIDGLRPYVPGAPASRIHWPALARGAGLLERRLVTEPHAHPLVVLDAREDGPSAPAELLDAAVRAAGSIILELARSGGCSVLLPGARIPVQVSGDLAAWPAVHTRLALVEGAGDDGPALREGIAKGSLIYVAARRQALTATPLAGRLASQLVLVVPTMLREGTTARPSFEVAGCTGFVMHARAGRARRRAVRG